MTDDRLDDVKKHKNKQKLNSTMSSTLSTRPAAVCDEHSSTINLWCQEAGSYQARAAGLPSLASRPTARPVQAVCADIQGAAWTGTVVHRRPLSTSHNRR